MSEITFTKSELEQEVRKHNLLVCGLTGDALNGAQTMLALYKLALRGLDADEGGRGHASTVVKYAVAQRLCPGGCEYTALTEKLRTARSDALEEAAAFVHGTDEELDYLESENCHREIEERIRLSKQIRALKEST